MKEELFTAAAITSKEIFGNPKVFFRRFIKNYMKIWLSRHKKIELSLPNIESPLDALNEYLGNLDKWGLQKSNEVKILSYENNDNIKILQNGCPYSETCVMMIEYFGETPVCIRAIYYIEAIERRLGVNGIFDYRFQYSTHQCKIQIAKLQELY
ncbi:MAG: hypothetical protein ACE5KE_07830 [Methanosarcinales archaeon]